MVLATMQRVHARSPLRPVGRLGVDFEMIEVYDQCE